jgi:hypothetical protein
VAEETQGVMAGHRLEWRTRIVGPFRRRAIEELKHRGYNEADAADMVGQIGDGKILEWIITHGPEILKFIEMLIGLFATVQPTPP